jgi:hypothetical protein
VQSTDREQFEEQLGVLCAGFNLPVTPHRRDAYWRGLAKMSLAQLSRCVDLAVSEEGPDDLPTPKQIWRMHRGFRSQGALVATQEQAKEDPRDHLLFFANRMFLRHLTDRGGLGSTGRFVPGYGMVDCKPSGELIAARKFTRDLVDYWTGPVSESDPDATPAEFIRQFAAGLSQVSTVESQTLRAWREHMDAPESQTPFGRHMARALEPRFARNDSLMPPPEAPQQQALIA